MPTRTATATGTIKNTGSTTITFAVDIEMVNVTATLLGLPGINSSASARQQVSLAPGVVSTPITLSTPLDVAPGQLLQAKVYLHRVNPSPQDNIAVSAPFSYTEPHILTGELNFTPGGIGALKTGFLFSSDGWNTKVGQIGAGEFPWVGMGLVAVAIFLMLGPKKLFGRKR